MVEKNGLKDSTSMFNQSKKLLNVSMFIVGIIFVATIVLSVIFALLVGNVCLAIDRGVLFIVGKLQQDTTRHHTRSLCKKLKNWVYKLFS